MGDTKMGRMNRAGIWTFLWVLWIITGVQGGMFDTGRPYFLLTLAVTGAGLFFVGFHWYRYFTFKEDKTDSK